MKRKKHRTPLPLPEKTQVATGREDEDGVPLLFWRVEIPALDAAFGKTDAASFYTELARRAEAYLTGEFAEGLRAEYRAADPARRRFSFRGAVYSHTVRCELQNGALTVERNVTLTRVGRVLFRRTCREAWDPADGSPLPSRDDRTVPPEKPHKKSRKKVDAGARDMI